MPKAIFYLLKGTMILGMGPTWGGKVYMITCNATRDACSGVSNPQIYLLWGVILFVIPTKK